MDFFYKFNMRNNLDNYIESASIEKLKPSIGGQIFHFTSEDVPYIKNIESVKFVNKYMKNAKHFKHDSLILKYACEEADMDGVFIEAGVATGLTTNFIAALKPSKNIYAFDSFKGLPSNWEIGNINIKKGAFALRDGFKPILSHNIKVIKGLFNDTMPVFKNEILKDAKISFIHIDCDIYESARDIFNALGENMISGTILAFDELYNYHSFEAGELKALNEFLESSGKEVEFIAFNENQYQVVARIK